MQTAVESTAGYMTIKELPRAICADILRRFALVSAGAETRIPWSAAKGMLTQQGGGHGDGASGQGSDLQLLDRADVDRVPARAGILAGRDGCAPRMRQGGAIASRYLFRGARRLLTNESQASISLGLIVFDAKTGCAVCRLGAGGIKRHVCGVPSLAAAVRAAVVKSRLLHRTCTRSACCPCAMRICRASVDSIL